MSHGAKETENVGFPKSQPRMIEMPNQRNADRLDRQGIYKVTRKEKDDLKFLYSLQRKVIKGYTKEMIQNFFGNTIQIRPFILTSQK